MEEKLQGQEKKREVLGMDAKKEEQGKTAEVNRGRDRNQNTLFAHMKICHREVSYFVQLIYNFLKREERLPNSEFITEVKCSGHLKKNLIEDQFLDMGKAR